MRPTLRLLLLLALVFGALGLVAAVPAQAGCPHGSQPASSQGASRMESPRTAAVAASHLNAKALFRATAEPSFSPYVGGAAGDAAPAGAACCSGAGCLMACQWVILVPDLALAPAGPGQRLAPANGARMAGRVATVPLPPPRLHG